MAGRLPDTRRIRVITARRREFGDLDGERESLETKDRERESLETKDGAREIMETSRACGAWQTFFESIVGIDENNTFQLQFLSYRKNCGSPSFGRFVGVRVGVAPC